MIQRSGAPLRTVWLMGVKTRLLGNIRGAVADLIEPGGSVLDVCSGTAVVGRSLAGEYRVIANDVQAFASTLARAHLVGGVQWRDALEYLDPEEDLDEAFNANLQALTALVAEPLSTETELLPKVVAQLRGEGASTTAEACSAVDDYRQLLEHSPRPGETDRATGSIYEGTQPLFSGFLDERRVQPGRKPFGLCTLYFQNTYFGLQQSLVLDSMRAAIASIPASDPFQEQKQDLYLAALVYAASVSTSGTSHFAQPVSARRDPELLRVAKRRCISIEDEFHIALDGIRREWGERDGGFEHRVTRGAAEEVLAADGVLGDDQVDLVYLDPPYTADNYSRFYHVLETLVNYDYPQFELHRGKITRGLYPVQEARFRSDFCRAGKVEGAFRRIAEVAAERGAKLLVSYAEENGLLFKHWVRQGETQPRARFRQLFRDYFDVVEIRDKSLLHSGQGDSNRPTMELLTLCE
ncbi:MAG: DNA adenine methylase [Planctomycetota bacterium]